MSDALRFVLAVFACYRLAQLAALDEGPWDVFLRFRTWAGAYRYGADGRADTNLGRMFACVYCVGVWAAAVCAGLVLARHAVTDALLLWLGIAGAQSVLESLSVRAGGEA